MLPFSARSYAQLKRDAEEAMLEADAADPEEGEAAA